MRGFCHPLRLVIIGCALVFSMAPAAAQEQRPPAGSQRTAQPTKRADKGPAERKLTPEQQRALWLLDGLLDDAKKLDDEQARVKTQARIADILWDYDEPRARQIFEHAFHDIDTIKPDAPPSREPSASMAGFSAVNALRSVVLVLVSAHDLNLAGKLIKSIKESDSARATNEAGATSAGDRSADRSMLYMQIATRMAATDPARAVELAKLGLEGGIHPMLSGLLFALRAKDARAADYVFKAALSVARTDPSHTGANLMLLMQYALPEFTPAMKIMRAALPGKDTLPAESGNPAAMSPFLDFAYEAITRQADGARAAAGDAASGPPQIQPEEFNLFVAAQMLLPAFEKYRPDQAVMVRARLDVIAKGFGDNREQLENAFKPRTTSDLIDEADKAPSSSQRDMLYIRAAQNLLGEGNFEQAVALSDKVSDERLKAMLGSSFRVAAANRSIARGDIDAAYRFAREIADVKMRATAFAAIAQAFLDRKDSTRATAMLNEAEALINKSDDGLDKARALLIIAGVAARVDQFQAFALTRKAVDVINRVDAAPPTENNQDAMGAITSMVESMTGTETLDFNPSLSVLARADFEGALELARALRKKERSVPAQIALCRGVLAAKPAGK